MPVVFVTDTQAHPKARVRRMLEAANRAVSNAVGAPRNSVWVRYEPGKPDFYWEGENGDVPTQSRPVFVRVRLLEGRDEAKLQALFAELSAAIAGALNMLPEYVWIQIEEMDPNRVAQGARTYAELRKKK